MKTIYTVYQLNEKVNKFGNPYIGFSKNIIYRARVWKKELELNYVPILTPLYFSTEEQQAFDWEQDKRVENGWRRERPLSNLRAMTSKSIKTKERQINAAKIAGKKAVDSGQLAAMRTKESILKGAKTTASIERICPHCNKTTKSNTYFMNHGDRCKLKPQI